MTGSGIMFVKLVLEQSQELVEIYGNPETGDVYMARESEEDHHVDKSMRPRRYKGEYDRKESLDAEGKENPLEFSDYVLSNLDLSGEY